MVRMQAILLRQNKSFDEIVIRKHKMFDVVFSDDQPLLTVEGGELSSVSEQPTLPDCFPTKRSAAPCSKRSSTWPKSH